MASSSSGAPGAHRTRWGSKQDPSIPGRQHEGNPGKEKAKRMTHKGSWRLSDLSSPCRDDEPGPREGQMSALGHTAGSRFKPCPPASQNPSSHLTPRYREGSLTQQIPHLPLVGTDQKWVPETAPDPALCSSCISFPNTPISNPNYPRTHSPEALALTHLLSPPSPLFCSSGHHSVPQVPLPSLQAQLLSS